MKKLFLIISLLMPIVFSACKESQATNDDHTALGVARTFIRSSLDGDFDKASQLLSSDTKGKEMLQMFQSAYDKLPEPQKELYKTASFEINNIKEENDSTTIVNFSNSYMKKPMDIKLVRQQGNWKVDFAFTALP